MVLYPKFGRQAGSTEEESKQKKIQSTLVLNHKNFIRAIGAFVIEFSIFERDLNDMIIMSIGKKGDQIIKETLVEEASTRRKVDMLFDFFDRRLSREIAQEHIAQYRKFAFEIIEFRNNLSHRQWGMFTTDDPFGLLPKRKRWHSDQRELLVKSPSEIIPYIRKMIDVRREMLRLFSEILKAVR